MPEGHVIHRLAQELNTSFASKQVQVSSPQGRFADEAMQLDGRMLLRSQACGKQLFLEFDGPELSVVHIHLGLIGKLFIRPLSQGKGVVRLRICDGVLAADLHGPQWCRLIGRDAMAQVISASGPDPIRTDSDPERGWERLHRSARPIANLLLDQTITAGVGNIYRAEVLFRHQIDPMLPGKQLSYDRWCAIWDDLVLLMKDGVVQGRIDTVRMEHTPEVMGRPPRVDPHGGEVYVYRRAGQPCLVCGTVICRVELAGRNLYWCSRCQQRQQ